MNPYVEEKMEETTDISYLLTELSALCIWGKFIQSILGYDCFLCIAEQKQS